MKNVSIVVVGVGKEINKAKTQFLAIASKNGKVFLYDNLQKLSNGLDEILEAACGKHPLHRFISLSSGFVLRVS